MFCILSYVVAALHQEKQQQQMDKAKQGAGEKSNPRELSSDVKAFWGIESGTGHVCI